MGTILNEADRAKIVTRMRSLSVSSTRRWGTMTVVSMLEHLHLSMRMAVDEMPVKSVNKRAFQVFPLKHLLLYVLPFPKGAPTAPELKPSAAESLEVERTAVLNLLEQLATRAGAEAGPDHPLFGPLTWREWGVLAYKHADHHLKQFGA